MIYAMIKPQVFVHLVANTALHMNSMKPRDVYGNNRSLFITKMIVNLVVKELHFGQSITIDFVMSVAVHSRG